MIGPQAQFREGQWEAIEAVAQQRSRVLVVQRTGWGKSLVYFIATKLLREQGAGPTALISPLLSLMRNQIEMAGRIGIRAATINSANPEDWDAVEGQLDKGQCDVLLVSPERLANQRFAQRTLPAIRGGIGLFVVDEAHCISDWGHDFRPDYRRIVRIIRALPRSVPVLGTTATANNRVVADVVEQLGPDLQVLRGPLARRSLRLQTIHLADQAERLAWLAEQLPRLPGTGIIYCLTVNDCRRVAAWLAQHTIVAPPYHADLDNETRARLEQMLLRSEVKALVATVALGMGFDKPDLGFIVHYQRPGSAVAYYQQIGRAGRAVNDARVVLLHGREDDEIADYFIHSAFPAGDELQQVLGVIAASEGATIGDILPRVNLSWMRVERALKLLEVEGAIARSGRAYRRTVNPWKPDLLRVERVTEQRRTELQRMQDFLNHHGCLMEFLTKELDDPAAAPCGHCVNCAGDLVSRATNPRVVREAITFLRRDYQVIAPRILWPAGGLGERTGRVPEELRNGEGRALCVYGDAGWGRMVAEGKYRTKHFSDELVAASADLIRLRWNPEPHPEWVTAVPSLRNPKLVSDYAQRLARALDLPFHALLVKVADSPPQKDMQNSAQQAASVARAFQVRGRCPSGPVLLVDDMVDSRWTMTMCGIMLRETGSGPVYPFALATASLRKGAA
jgi:ATP-dependent DNA helicase RecQ